MGPKSPIARIVRCLGTRPDSEHEMRFNALGFGTAILTYLLATGGSDRLIFAVPPAYLATNLAVLGHILRYPCICRPRRIFSIVSDVTALSCVMQIGGETTAILFPLYVWLILGNGFRFGLGFLALATVAGLAAFGAVSATTPFWSAHAALTAGLFGAMLLVPLGAMPLIRRLSRDKCKAEAANREMGVLLAGMSHELRTPLTAIIGTGSVLQDTRLSPAQQEMARRVVSAGHKLLKLIEDLPEGAARGRPGRSGDR